MEPGPRRILLVDDEAEIRIIARMALEMVGGFEVRDFGSAEEALAAAAEVRPDLLLLDVMMPGMDGLQALARLRRIPATVGTPAIFMTAKVQPAEVAAYEALGAIGVIAKPFSPMALPDEVRRLWKRAAEEVSTCAARR
ncbi:MAG TPA: response regulator [Usitatibacter sp.]|nr:response regulator [Usitatibacter sp.]